MKPMFVTVLVFVALGLLARCQPTMPASSLAADMPSPAPGSGSAIAGAATATLAPPPSPQPSPTPEATAVEATPLPPLTLPAGWQSYTTGSGLTFACPPGWRVILPSPDKRVGTYGVRLEAPAAQFPGGNVFTLFDSRYGVAPGQSLREWAQQVFLAERDSMIPPRAILDIVDLPEITDGQGLLVTQLVGSDPGWHRHHVYLRHGATVLDLSGDTTQAQSAAAAEALKAIAVTVRVAAPPPTPDERALGGPNLATVAARATAEAQTTATPRCDIVCRDATAVASITPGPLSTYPPAFATQEAQSYSMMATREAEARRVTPTPPPSVTPSPTPKPADQPGLVLYEGKSPEGPFWTPRPFQLAYDPSWWQRHQEASYDYLAHRQLPSCQLWINPGGRGVGGPLVAEQIHLAGLDWDVYHHISDGLVSYLPKLQGIGLWFNLEMGSWAPASVVQPCRQAAEEVLNTLRIQ